MGICYNYSVRTCLTVLCTDVNMYMNRMIQTLRLLAGFSASLPVPEIARFAVSVKLLNATFTDDVKAQQSDQYEDMKTVMVVAVSQTATTKHIIQSELI